MTRALALAAAVAAFAWLPGCGGDDEPERPAAGAQTQAETSTTEAAPAATAPSESVPRTETDGPEAEPPRTERRPAAATAAPGLPSKRQRQATADGVCRAAERAPEDAPVHAICAALRRAARADTAEEYRRALAAAGPLR